MKARLLAGLFATLAAAAAFAAAERNLLITGAGATFPAPLYTRWFSLYNEKHPAVRINYQAIGSGGGIRQFTEKTVDFGASDAPMSDEELRQAPGTLHLPMVLGAVVITWNEPEVKSLKLSPETLAGIFLGKITRWNDPAIAKENLGEKLPPTPIVVVHRADGSGTTFVFTDYMTKASLDFKEHVGVGKSVSWPAGLGAHGNEGVTGMIKSTRGAIGYVELAYARQSKMPVAELKNREGHFVRPSLEATSAAAEGVQIPDDFRVSITNAPGRNAWPISAFTYVLLRRDLEDAAMGEALTKFLWWAIHEGQGEAAPLDYAPLPKAVVARLEPVLKGIRLQGKPVQLGMAP
jgi:phosphate transport system substrate-binding protein